MSTWVFWRRTLPAALTLCETSSVAASFRLSPKLRSLLGTSLLLARIGEPVDYVRTIPDLRDGQPFPEDVFRNGSSRAAPYA